VFGKSRKVETEQELYDIALRALMRRSHSVSEMKKLLARRADTDLLAQVVLARLKESGQLDDARYAKQFVRQRTNIRRQGKFRIMRDLRARGVPDRHIEAALESVSADQADSVADEASLIRHRIDRKLKLLRGPSSDKRLDDKKIASLYRSLLRAGFPADSIRRQLKSLTSSELPDANPSVDD
jgi:regulatory protein